MKKKERLKVYKKMLRDYTISNIFLIGWMFKGYLNTDSGFCYYLQNSSTICDLPDLIELYKLRPEKTYGPFWFKRDLLKPRIELLKKAISDTEMHTKTERLMLEI